MRIVIIGQEEPIYFGPFLRSIIELRHKDIAALVISGERSAGGHPKTFRHKLENIYILWLIMEPFGFLRNIWLRLYQRYAGFLGSCFDRRSITGAAEKYSLPIIYTQDINSKDFLEKLRSFHPDIIINQSEHLLKEEILSIPKIGVINRHASLLPHFRGRLASFWGHSQEPPEYGVTIHFVNKEIDSGPIIVQKKFDIDPCLSYTKVLDILFKQSVELTLEAFKKLEEGDFSPMPASKKHQYIHSLLCKMLKHIGKYCVKEDAIK